MARKANVVTRNKCDKLEVVGLYKCSGCGVAEGSHEDLKMSQAWIKCCNQIVTVGIMNRAVRCMASMTMATYSVRSVLIERLHLGVAYMHTLTRLLCVCDIHTLG